MDNDLEVLAICTQGQHLVFVSVRYIEKWPVELIQKIYDLSEFEYKIGNVRHFILENKLTTQFLLLQVMEVCDLKVQALEIDYNNEVNF